LSAITTQNLSGIAATRADQNENCVFLPQSFRKRSATEREAILVEPQQIAAYEADGAVLIPGLFRDWVDVIAAGIERNMEEPGPYAAENLKHGESGRFFDDYCNWDRIPEFEKVIRESDAALVAARLMRSKTAQLFHDHVLVKEPGTSRATPWHQDSPYYFVEGNQTVSFWSPVESVNEATLRFVAGSHR
jgi:ectoine hydroxylase-related dioxygenase (phytanoyl-CoA dioxygenase family)